MRQSSRNSPPRVHHVCMIVPFPFPFRIPATTDLILNDVIIYLLGGLSVALVGRILIIVFVNHRSIFFRHYPPHSLVLLPSWLSCLLAPPRPPPFDGGVTGRDIVVSNSFLVETLFCYICS